MKRRKRRGVKRDEIEKEKRGEEEIEEGNEARKENEEKEQYLQH